MMSRVIGWVCLLSAVGVLGACGKSESSAAPVSREELPRAVADLLCDSLAPCCDDAGQPFDIAACKSTWMAQISASYDELDSTRVEYDAAAAGECLAGVRGHVQCGEVDNDGEDVPACENILRGKVAEGQPCETSQECARSAGEDASCEYDDASLASRCKIYRPGSQPRGKAGDNCNQTCDDAGGESCTTFVSPGGPTTPSAPPAACHTSDGLYCAFDQITFSQTCAALSKAGEPCNDFGDNCGHGSVCDYNSRLCTLPRANGQACDANELCTSEFCSNQGLCGPRTVSAEECSLSGDID